MTKIRLANAAAMRPGESVRFEAYVAAVRVEGFVLRHGESFVAFRNRCPHWHVDLDLGLGHPYDADTGLVFCRNHGALFRPEDGLCIAGPCAGERLERYAVWTEGPDAVVDLVKALPADHEPP